MCVSVSVCLNVWMSVWERVCVCVCESVCVCVSVYVCVSVCDRERESVCVCVCVCVVFNGLENCQNYILLGQNRRKKYAHGHLEEWHWRKKLGPKDTPFCY
jgi:hypothetical protein